MIGLRYLSGTLGILTLQASGSPHIPLLPEPTRLRCRIYVRRTAVREGRSARMRQVASKWHA